MAGHPARTRAGNVLQGASGNARRQASLPCLDTKISCLAPSVVYPLYRRFVVTCFCVSSSTPKYFRTFSHAFDRSPSSACSYTTRLERSPEGRDASKTGKDLAKSSHPHATGARNQTFTGGNCRGTRQLDQKYTPLIRKQHANGG